MMDKEQRQPAEELLFPECRSASFAKLLYCGVFDPRHIFSYLQVYTVQKRRTERLLGKLKLFCEKGIDPVAIRRHCFRQPLASFFPVNQRLATMSTLARFYGSYALDKLDNAFSHFFADNQDKALSPTLTGDCIQ